MSSPRRVLVLVTICGSIALALVAIVLDRELWPFSPYPMYSRLSGAQATPVRAVGVMLDGRELDLADHIEPARARLSASLARVKRLPGHEARLVRIARAMLAEHERQRIAGADLPPLRAVRLYRDSIDLSTSPHRVTTTLLAEGTP